MPSRRGPEIHGKPRSSVLKASRPVRSLLRRAAQINDRATAGKSLIRHPVSHSRAGESEATIDPFAVLVDSSEQLFFVANRRGFPSVDGFSAVLSSLRTVLGGRTIVTPCPQKLARNVMHSIRVSARLGIQNKLPSHLGHFSRYGEWSR